MHAHDAKGRKITDYWPAGLPHNNAGVAEHMRCHAREYDFLEAKRLAGQGKPPLEESTPEAERLWRLAAFVERVRSED